jgi:predicted XRE-type DNA-binding protein
LKDTKDAEEDAEEVKTQSSLENQVEDLMDVSGFRVQSKIDEELENLIK